MDTPPPLAPPAPPPSFKLPPSAWIAWGVCAAIWIALFFVRNSAADAYHVGELLGGVVALLILPTLVAWVVWRLSGRSQSNGTVTFFVVFALAVSGQVVQFNQRAQANAALARIKVEQQEWQAEQKAALAQGRPVDTSKAVKLAAQTSAQLGAMAENSSGRDRAMAEGGKAYMDQMMAAKQRYDAAVKAIDTGTFWNLQKFEPGAPAEARRKAVKAFAQANKALAGFQDENGTELRRVLQEHGATAADIQGAVDGYRSGAGARLPMIGKIRTTDAQLAQVMLEFLDFEETSRGQWKLDETDGKILFQQQAALDRYNELIARANAISAEQAKYQKQVFAGKP